MSSRRLQYVSIGTRSDHSRTCKDTNQIKVTFTKVSFDLEFLRRAALTRVARAGSGDAGAGRLHTADRGRRPPPADLDGMTKRTRKGRFS